VRVLCLALVLVGASSAHADRTRSERRHAAYVELLGKGGLWGAGYDFAPWSRVALGVTGSAYVHEGERLLSLSPYVAVYPLGRGSHRAFVQLGPQLVRLDRMSPVPEWPGQTTSGLGAELCAGYELRTRLLVRAFAMTTIGKQGVAPWAGISIGVTL